MSDNATPSFETYKNYLRAFACLAGFQPVSRSPQDVLEEIREAVANEADLRSPPPSTARLADVRKALNNAWGTELLLCLGGQYASEEELLRVTNNWAAVQLYYVLYHATQALVLAGGHLRPTSHSKTQALFMDFWASRAMHVPPWTLSFGDSGCRNVPGGFDVSTQITTVVAPRTPAMCWSYAATALRTTREQFIPDAVARKRQMKKRALRETWIAQEQQRQARGVRTRKEPRFALPRLTSEELRQVHAGVRPYTFMDFAYRLRIKTNYEDSQMFIDGPIDTGSSRQVHQDMSKLASASLLVNELRIRHAIGQSAMARLVDGWLAANNVAGAIGLAQRRDLILT